MKGFDAAGRMPPNIARSLGFSFVGGYYCQLPNGKAFSKGEVEGWTAAGFGIIAVWENLAQAALGGAAQGMSDGVAALAMARSLDQPRGSAVFAAVDFEPLGEQVPVVNAYLKAFKGVLNTGGYLAGPYGGIATVAAAFAAGAMDVAWQTTAWSSGEVSPHSSILQGAPPTTAEGWNFDVDTALKSDFGAWNLNGLWPVPTPKPTPTPPPLPKEYADMAAAAYQDADGVHHVYIVSAGGAAPANHLLHFSWDPRQAAPDGLKEGWSVIDVVADIEEITKKSHPPNGLTYLVEP